MKRTSAFAGAGADRVTMWPITLACCFPLTLIMLWSGPFDLAFFGAPILLVAWGCSALIALGMVIFSVRARNWRRAASMSVLPLATLVATTYAVPLWQFAIECGNSIHFLAMSRSYLEEVSKLPSSDEPRFAVWEWGGFGVGHAVVYDESDEIELTEQSSGWKKRVAKTEVGMCGVRGSPLGNHFYLVRTGC